MSVLRGRGENGRVVVVLVLEIIHKFPKELTTDKWGGWKGWGKR
jgi:hypothetical protein